MTGTAKKASSGSSAYYKFSREFVVPIMRGGQVTSLVILHSLETDSSTSEKMFSEEAEAARQYHDHADWPQQ